MRWAADGDVLGGGHCQSGKSHSILPGIKPHNLMVLSFWFCLFVGTPTPLFPCRNDCVPWTGPSPTLAPSPPHPGLHESMHKASVDSPYVVQTDFKIIDRAKYMKATTVWFARIMFWLFRFARSGPRTANVWIVFGTNQFASFGDSHLLPRHGHPL